MYMKKALLIGLTTLMLISIATVVTATPWDGTPDDNTPAQAIWIDPKNTACLEIDDTFVVDVLVNITDPDGAATGMWGWQYQLEWDTTVLDVVEIQTHGDNVPAGDLMPGHTAVLVADNTTGLANHTYVVIPLMGSAFTGVNSLCTYKFKVISEGSCPLDIIETGKFQVKLTDDKAGVIPLTVVDGVYCTAAPECEVTFLTDPAGSDYSITFEGKTYHDGDMDTFANGTSGLATTSCPVGWVFDSWETADNVSVTDSTVTITCGGSLKAVFVEKALAPTIESCDSTGAKKDIFDLEETVYVNGSDYAPKVSIYEIYVVNDTAWNDGKPIPARVPGTVTTVSSNSFGKIDPTAVWSDLTVGKYDIVVDVNNNTVYDEGVDALDDLDIQDTAGFLVIPEYALGAILGLIACFAAFGVFLRFKRQHRV